MFKYIYICTYSPGSWARLTRVRDDRVKAGQVLADALGGSLEYLLWEVDAGASYALADMPDSSAATAAVAVLNHTGAFKSVEVHELLTPEQFNGMLDLAGDASKVFQVPGHRHLSADS